MIYHSLARHIVELTIFLGSIGIYDARPAVGQDVGEPAPAFSLYSILDETHTLEQYQGNYVVLEWMNFRCRIVDQLYKEKTLPTMQSEFREQGVVWLSIVSDAEGKQGQVGSEKMLKQIEKREGSQDAVLLDLNGIVGRMYSAKVSPHMVLIDPAGVLIYLGAIDNQPPGDDFDEEPHINYVANALEQAMNGEPVQYPITEAYGCPIRYDRK